MEVNNGISLAPRKIDRRKRQYKQEKLANQDQGDAPLEMSGTLQDQQADEYAVIEESMHMAGMKEEHYNGHTPSQQKNCPYKGAFLTYQDKHQGNGPNKWRMS